MGVMRGGCGLRRVADQGCRAAGGGGRAAHWAVIRGWRGGVVAVEPHRTDTVEALS